MAEITEQQSRRRGRPRLDPAKRSQSKTATFYLTSEMEAALESRVAMYPQGRSGALRHVLSQATALLDMALPRLSLNEWEFVLFHLQGLLPVSLTEVYEDSSATKRATDLSSQDQEFSPTVARQALVDALLEEGAASGLNDVARTVERVRKLNDASMIAVGDLALRYWVASNRWSAASFLGQEAGDEPMARDIVPPAAISKRGA
ncbi:hypothetical protein ABMY26_33890 [Azospirillum sp. HJ39]|uniref:hypothetical protein n=1 Tax=Azospirillum sp. HJ39 TaxID=3159496 RepID=UPI003558052A